MKYIISIKVYNKFTSVGELLDGEGNRLQSICKAYGTGDALPQAFISYLYSQQLVPAKLHHAESIKQYNKKYDTEVEVNFQYIEYNNCKGEP